MDALCKICSHDTFPFQFVQNIDCSKLYHFTFLFCVLCLMYTLFVLVLIGCLTECMIGLELHEFCVFDSEIIVFCDDGFELKSNLECMMTLSVALFLILLLILSTAIKIGLLRLLTPNTDGLLLNLFNTSAITAELGDSDTFASDGYGREEKKQIEKVVLNMQRTTTICNNDTGIVINVTHVYSVITIVVELESAIGTYVYLIVTELGVFAAILSQFSLLFVQSRVFLCFFALPFENSFSFFIWSFCAVTMVVKLDLVKQIYI